jgi:sugar phosphate isomerase/epimerase
MEQDVRGTLQAVADAGYKQVELMDAVKDGEKAKIAKDLGMKVSSSFMDWTTICGPSKDSPSVETTIDAAKKLGLKYLVFGYVGKGHRETPDQFKSIADKCNALGEQCKKAGIQLCYHNHSFEFTKLDGDQTGFDVFIDRFDKELTKFELDVFWVQIGGWDPIETMHRLNGRIAQLHLKDLLKGTPTIWDESAVPHEAFKELGEGVVDIDSVVDVGRKIGVEQCHVEQDQSPSPLQSIKTSIKYLRDA